MFNEAYSFTVVYLGLRQITHPLPAVLLCVSSERDLGYNSEDRVIKHLSHFPCFSLCLAIVLRKNEEVVRQYSEYVHLKISLLIVFHVGCLVPVWCIMGIVSSEILTEKKELLNPNHKLFRAGQVRLWGKFLLSGKKWWPTSVTRLPCVISSSQKTCKKSWPLKSTSFPHTL